MDYISEQYLEERLSRALKGYVARGAIAGGAMAAGSVIPGMGLIAIPILAKYLKSRGNEHPWFSAIIGIASPVIESQSIVKPSHLNRIKKYLVMILEKEGNSKEEIEKKLTNIRYSDAEKILTRGQNMLQKELNDVKVKFREKKIETKYGDSSKAEKKEALKQIKDERRKEVIHYLQLI